MAVVPADLLHFVRHGEVHNPDRILYGRLDNFGLSDRGHDMANRVAQTLKVRPIARVIASPLLRTQQSALPIAEALGLPVDTDDRIIEADNVFEGTRLSPGTILKDASTWKNFRNPWLPSWGEPYRDIASRMMAAAEDALTSVDEGEVVLVSHQLPIWMLHKWIAGIPLPHIPSSRRCSLSSVTSFRKVGERWKEESYREPAHDLLEQAIDLGAV
jgi:broad specificity phosphatase PhoE